MNTKAMSANAWRRLLALFGLLCVTVLVIDLAYSWRVLTPGAKGRVGAVAVEVGYQSRQARRIVSMSADSPLAAAGAAVGDLYLPAVGEGRYGTHAVGEVLRFTLVHDGVAKPIVVTTIAAEGGESDALSAIFGYASSMVLIALALLIGYRRADDPGCRFLSAALLCGMLTWFPIAMAAGVMATAAAALGVLGGMGFYWFFVRFGVSLNMSAIASRRLRILLACFAFLCAAVGLAHAASVVTDYRLLLADGFAKASAVVAAIGSLLSAVSFRKAWRRADALGRQRLRWIILSFVLILVSAEVYLLDLGWHLLPDEAATTGLVFGAATLVANIVLAYAVLRYRIFDFGFAVSRALVFGLAGAILLATFQSLQFVVGEFLHFEDKNKTALLSAVLAIAVYLSFAQLKRGVEQLVDRTFFAQWKQREEGLRRFVKEAQANTDARSLGTAFVAAIERFTAAAGCALYSSRDDAAYGRAEASLADAPEAVDANDAAVIALKAHREVLHLDETDSALHAALAVPMLHGHALVGFVLVGAKRDGEAYRPDEIGALQFAAHEVGLALHALRVKALEQRLAEARREADVLRAQLQTALHLSGGRSA